MHTYHITYMDMNERVATIDVHAYSSREALNALDQLLEAEYGSDEAWILESIERVK